MHCPKCGEARDARQVTCTGCGLVFHKYEQYLARQQTVNAGADVEPSGFRPWLATLWHDLLLPPDSVRAYFWVYVGLWAALIVWGLSYLVQDVSGLGHNPGFMHNVNLPFHEFGHLLFGVLGDFMGSLGGTLGQLLMPVVCAAALLRTRGDTFGASVCLLWFGQNMLDIAPYMADARAGALPLLGGNFGRSSPYGFHDWEFILGETGLLPYDTLLAGITLNIGRIVMVLAMAWGAYVLWRAWSEDDV